MADPEVVLERHVAALARAGLRPSTIYQRRRVAARLEAHTGKPWLACDRDDLHSFLDRPLGSESRATEVSHLRGLFGWAYDEELITVDPAARLRRPKLPRRLPRPISEDDLALAVTTATPQVRAMLLLAAFAGLRAMEIAGLRAEDLWWNSSPPGLVVNDGKGGEPGWVPLNPDLADALRACDLPKRGWLFPRSDGQAGPLKPHSVSHKANGHLHSLGIGATLHQLRHRFGTELLRASGGNVRVAQEGLRHRSITSTQRYTAVGNEEVADAVSQLPSLRLQRDQAPTLFDA